MKRPCQAHQGFGFGGQERRQYEYGLSMQEHPLRYSRPRWLGISVGRILESELATIKRVSWLRSSKCKIIGRQQVTVPVIVNKPDSRYYTGTLNDPHLPSKPGYDKYGIKIPSGFSICIKATELLRWNPIMIYSVVKSNLPHLPHLLSIKCLVNEPFEGEESSADRTFVAAACGVPVAVVLRLPGAFESPLDDEDSENDSSGSYGRGRSRVAEI